MQQNLAIWNKQRKKKIEEAAIKKAQIKEFINQPIIPRSIKNRDSFYKG